MTRVVVSGDRRWTNVALIARVLEAVAPDCIIQGGAHGADTIARRFAATFEIPSRTFNANWNEYGSAAGPIRNKRMLERTRPDLALCFHPDLLASRGTRDLVMQALRSGIPVLHWDGIHWLPILPLPVPTVFLPGDEIALRRT